MNDAGHGIQIDIQSAPLSVMEQSKADQRYTLGYISGEFSKNTTIQDLYVKIWFKRGVDLDWESINYRLNPGEKYFRQKIYDINKTPQQLSLTVTECYVQLYGWIEPNNEDPDLVAEFELTAFELSIKEVTLGKYGGSVLLTFKDEE